MRKCSRCQEMKEDSDFYKGNCYCKSCNLMYRQRYRKTQQKEANVEPHADTFWAYLAGYIDADGSITLCQNGPRTTISNTHLETLQYIQDALGGIGYIQGQTTHSLKRTKPCYNLSFGSNATELLLPKLIPFLREKKLRAEELLSYMELCIKNRDPERITKRQAAAEEYRAKWSPRNNFPVY